jgi:cell division protein FtsB
MVKNQKLTISFYPNSATILRHRSRTGADRQTRRIDAQEPRRARSVTDRATVASALTFVLQCVTLFVQAATTMHLSEKTEALERAFIGMSRR